MSLWFRHCEMFKSDFSLRQSQTGFSTRCLTKHICCRMHRNYRWLTVKSITVRVNWAILGQSLKRLVCRICSIISGLHQIWFKGGFKKDLYIIFYYKMSSKAKYFKIWKFFTLYSIFDKLFICDCVTMIIELSKKISKHSNLHETGYLTFTPPCLAAKILIFFLSKLV